MIIPILQALPVLIGVVKVLFVVSRFQKITFNHTNDSDALLVASLLGAHIPMFTNTNTEE